MFTSVLFLCQNNASRSILAEALLNELGKEEFAVASAGFSPEPIQPLVNFVLTENYIEPSGFHSKPVSESESQNFDYVIALSDQGEDFPSIPIPGRLGQFHWTFGDPARSGATLFEQLVAYRRLVLELRMRLTLFAIIARRPRLAVAA